VDFSAGPRTPDRHFEYAKIRHILSFIRRQAACTVATMSRLGMGGSNDPRGAGPSGTYTGTILSIVLLLAGWFIIGHWNQLPQLIDSTMAALP
jgi:hypothetical protein